MMASASDPLDRFWDVARKASNVLLATPGTAEAEPYMRELLNLVKSHPALRPRFEIAFLDMVRAHGDHARISPYAIEILEFCMHDLRWPTIRAAAEAVARSSRDPNTPRRMQFVIDAFENTWAGEEEWDYYSEG